MPLLSIALVLHLYNFAGAPPSVVHAAERELTRVYADIGVRVEWNHAASAHAGDPAAIRVILVARESGEVRHTPHAVMGAAMWTPQGTPAVYVFYQRVRAEAQRYAVSIALVMACTLAHELGHVLMPESGHSRDGLMRACWDRDDFHRADRGQLRFLPEQVARIRAGIRAGD